VSVDYWWIGCFVDGPAHARLEPYFTAASASSALTPEARQAIAAWRADPRRYEEEFVLDKAPEPADQVVDQINAFLCAFNLPGFMELARDITLESGALPDTVTEQNLFRMAITARHPPVSIVWHALGFERAVTLPGQMGNMLLLSGEVEAALEATRRVYSGLSPGELFATAQRFCGLSVGEEPLQEALYFLPEALEQAAARRLGFFAVTCPRM
jgi:hypothetical protein